MRTSTGLRRKGVGGGWLVWLPVGGLLDGHPGACLFSALKITGQIGHLLFITACDSRHIDGARESKALDRSGNHGIPHVVSFRNMTRINRSREPGAPEGAGGRRSFAGPISSDPHE